MAQTKDPREAKMFDVLTRDLVITDGDIDYNVSEYVKTEMRRLKSDQKFREACILQQEDVHAVLRDGASFKVVEPQCYDCITTLDRAHERIFQSPDGDDSDTQDMGAFDVYPDWNGDAVTGYGADIWYKVSEELLDFCEKLYDETMRLKEERKGGDSDTLKRLERELGDFDKEFQLLDSKRKKLAESKRAKQAEVHEAMKALANASDINTV